MTRLTITRCLSPLALRRTRAARSAGWLGLLGFVWAAVALPAAHAIQHVREAAADDAAAARAEDVHALLRAFIHGGATTPLHGHHHTHDGAPDSDHGRGSAQHFDLALLGVDPPRVPPLASHLVALDALPPIDAPAPVAPRSARTTRGPPAPAAS